MADPEDDELEDKPKPRPQPQPTIAKPIAVPNMAGAEYTQPADAPGPTYAAPRPAPAPLSPIIGGGPSTTGTPSMQPSPVAQPQPEPTPGGSPLTSIAQPIVSAPRPAGSRYEELAAQGAPEYHGLKRVLDTIAGATKIGSAVEEAGGFGTQGYEARLARAGQEAGAEESQIAAAQKERQAAAETEKTGAEAGEATARGKAAEMGAENVMITLPNGQSVTVPHSALGQDIRALITQQGRSQDVAATNTSKMDIAQVEDANKLAIAQGKPQPTKVMMVNGEPHYMERDPGTGNYSIDRGLAPPNYAEIAPSLRTVDIISPNTGVPTVTTLGGREIGTAATGPMAGMGLMAGTVQQQIPRLKQEIQNLAQKLGPAAGRWHEAYVNGVGANDPDFAGLDSDLDLLASAIVRTHFGARGGLGYREALKKQFGEAQSPQDLMSRIDHADQWVQGYARMAAPIKPGGGTAAPTQGAPKSFKEFMNAPH